MKSHPFALILCVQQIFHQFTAFGFAENISVVAPKDTDLRYITYVLHKLDRAPPFFCSHSFFTPLTHSLTHTHTAVFRTAVFRFFQNAACRCCCFWRDSCGCSEEDCKSLSDNFPDQFDQLKVYVASCMVNPSCKSNDCPQMEPNVAKQLLDMEREELGYKLDDDDGEALPAAGTAPEVAAATGTL